jgi:hypothetical protein
MKKNTHLLLLILGLSSMKAQITPPYPIPEQIPEYNGTYEDFGRHHFFYPNDGEIRFDNEDHSDARDVVQFYTKFTHPKEYLLRNTSISFVFSKDDADASTPDSLHRIDLKMERASTTAFLARVDTQKTAVLHYFTQWFGAAGRTPVEGGAAIAAQNIYPNVDMVYCSNNTGLKLFYIVYPGGDPNQIMLKFDGAKSTGITGDDLIVTANWDEIKFVKPQMYQYTYINNVVTPVNVCPASWQSLGADIYNVTTTSSWNSALPLIIQVSQGPATQPTRNGINWSTYYGADTREWMHKAHTDASNNLFVGGMTASANFPMSSGAFQTQPFFEDGVIAKFDVAGVLIWSAYIGGSGSEEIYDFDFNGGDVYCVGKTHSNDLPVSPKGFPAFNDNTFGGVGFPDGFITQIGFNSLGGMVNKWTTYVGGNNEDILRGCKFDLFGNFFVVGSSASTDLSTVGSAAMYQQAYNPAQASQAFVPVPDALIMRFDAGTSAQSWLTFFGTSALGANANNVANDYFYGIDIWGVDVYACGKAGGTNLPGSVNTKFLAGSYDGMVAYFSVGGALSSSKFTDGNLVNYAVKVNNNSVYLAGQANSGMSTINSGNYYFDGTCAAGDRDACFSVHTMNLATTDHNTFLGGSAFEAAYDLQFSNNGVMYIAGATMSPNFPTTNLGAMFTSTAIGGLDNFVTAHLHGNPNMLWSTYLGSPSHESLFQPDGGVSVALTTQNVLHVGGCTASSNTYPLDNGGGIPYFQPQNNGNQTTGTITRFDMTDLNIFVGIEDFENTAFSFGFYPNPTAMHLTVDNPALVNQELRYAIYDLAGKKLAEGRLDRGQRSIDVSSLAPGVYIVNVSDGTQTFSNKFIKADK